MKAFTLIEVLVYMGLFSLFTATLATSSWQIQHAARDADARSSTIQRQLLDSVRSNRLHHEGR